jgi:hypothetical protein
MRYALMGIMGGFFLAFAAPAAAPASYPQLSLATTTDLSYNWAGYVSQDSGPYSGVTGRWIVPKVTDSQSLSADATWVGIGGTNTDDLIQAGTQAIVERTGEVSYEAWLELMPEASVPLPIHIAAGDEVSVDIHRVGTDRWGIVIADSTSGDTYRTQVNYNSNLSSAEWIEEMPATLGGGFIPLDAFGSVRFLSGTATVGGTKQTIAQLGALPLSMINRRGEALAVTSVLSDAGGFIVARSAAAPTLRRSSLRYGQRPGIYR